MIIKSSKNEPIQYIGSIALFRAWMDRLMSKGGGRMFHPFPEDEKNRIFLQEAEKARKAILAKHDKKPSMAVLDMSLWSWQLHIRYSERDKDSNREVWYVYLYDPKVSKQTFVPNKCATILAIEQPPNTTIVEFLDGINFREGLETAFPYVDRIGEMFSDYAQYIKDEWEKQTKILTSDVNKPRKEINLQTKPAGRKIDPWNPQAFDILNDGNEKSELRSFEFWCEKQGIQKPKASDRAAFKKAMKREEERRGRNR